MVASALGVSGFTSLTLLEERGKWGNCYFTIRRNHSCLSRVRLVVDELNQNQKATDPLTTHVSRRRMQQICTHEVIFANG